MVEIKFRAVTGKTYTLDVSPETTVLKMKQQLEEVHGLSAAGLKMILSAKVLADATQVKDIVIPPGTYIVIHVQNKARPAPSANPPAPANPPAAAPPKAEPVPAEQPSVPPPVTEPPAQPVPQPAVQPRPATPPAASVPSDPPNFATLVGQLTELGFEQGQCEQALRIANYNAENAANLLLSGDLSSGSAATGGGYAGGYGGGGGGGAGQYGGGGGGARFGELQSVYDGLSPTEKATVDRLLQVNPDGGMVIQLYMACDKNEEQTRALLG